MHTKNSVALHKCTKSCTKLLKMNNKNTLKIARGYRLKPSTHKLIKSLQELTNADSDTVLSESCKLYYKKLIELEILNNMEATK